MPLLSRDAVLPRLRCPVCRSPLDATAEHCTSPACEHARSPFRSVLGQPVLIDVADSIMDPAAVAPASPRKQSRLLGLIGRMGPKNRVAERIARRVIADLRAERDGRATVLVVGGGTIGSGLDELYAAAEIDIVAFDVYPSASTQFVADGHRIPLADGSVDAVIVQAVLEHVLDPWRVVAEIHRVLAPRGLVYADTPFLQQVHEGPFDFTRFTESGHRWLFRAFERIDSGVVAGPGTQLTWSLAHTARALIPVRGVATAVGLATQAAGTLVDRVARRGVALDGASSVFFYGRRSERAIAPREMIAHYQGAQPKPRTDAS